MRSAPRLPGHSHRLPKHLHGLDPLLQPQRRELDQLIHLRETIWSISANTFKLCTCGVAHATCRSHPNAGPVDRVCRAPAIALQ